MADDDRIFTDKDRSLKEIELLQEAAPKKIAEFEKTCKWLFLNDPKTYFFHRLRFINSLRKALCSELHCRMPVTTVIV